MKPKLYIPKFNKNFIILVLFPFVAMIASMLVVCMCHIGSQKANIVFFLSVVPWIYLFKGIKMKLTRVELVISFLTPFIFAICVNYYFSIVYNH